MSDFPQTAFGEVLTAKLTPQAAWRFDYGINSRLVTKTETNGGAVTVDGNRAKLATGVNVGGVARIETVKRLRYFPGMGGVLRMTYVHSAPKALSNQYFGLGDTADRLFFGYNNLNWVIGRRRGGVDTVVVRNDWNGEFPAGIDFTKGNIFQIRYQWLGYGYLRFFMLDPNGQEIGYKLMHTINYPNTSADVHILNPTLPIFAEVANTGNNTNIVAYTPSAAAFVEGEVGEYSNPMDVFNSFDTSATLADTNNNHLATIRNKSTFLTLANRVPIQINSVTFTRGSGSPASILRLYKAATTAGARVYADHDANNSPIDTSATTTTITGGTVERSYSIPASGSRDLTFKPGELVLQPGEALTFGQQNSGVQSTDSVLTVNWSELF